MSPDLSAEITRHAAELESKAKELEAQAAELNVHATKMRAAAKILRGKEPRKKSTKPGEKWTPKPETVQRVREVIVSSADGEVFTLLQLAERTGLSTETVRRSVVVLRRNEEIRAAGQNGSTVLWAKMP